MAELKTHQYRVEMTCEGCSGAVQRVLDKLKSSGTIEKIDISLKDQKVLVTTTLSSDEVLQVIKKTGKAAEYISSH